MMLFNKKDIEKARRNYKPSGKKNTKTVYIDTLGDSIAKKVSKLNKKGDPYAKWRK